MKTLTQFNALSDTALKTLLANHGVFCPPKIQYDQLIDYARNRLHGLEFINDEEEIINGKCTRKEFVPTAKTAEDCPSCKQPTLRKLTVIGSDIYDGWVHCGYCGLYLSKEEKVIVDAAAASSSSESEGA